MKQSAQNIGTLCLMLLILGITACKTTGKGPGLVEVKGGTYTIGTSGDTLYAVEAPSHQVTLSTFSIGAYEVTVGQFRAFTEATGYKTEAEAQENGGGHIYDKDLKEWVYKADATWKNPYITQNDNHPVVLVSWNDAVAYCNWLSGKDGYKPAYAINGSTVELIPGADGYRLPTEAEWEYACRAGTTTAFSNGKNTIGMDEANFAYSGDDSYQGGGNAKDDKNGTVEVGSYKANPWEIFDMYGNVWEWCWDWYGMYPGEAQTDPLGPDSAVNRVNRGGGWTSSAEFLRSSSRGELVSRGCSSDLGFRIARTVAPK